MTIIKRDKDIIDNLNLNEYLYEGTRINAHRKSIMTDKKINIDPTNTYKSFKQSFAKFFIFYIILLLCVILFTKVFIMYIVLFIYTIFLVPIILLIFKIKTSVKLLEKKNNMIDDNEYIEINKEKIIVHTNGFIIDSTEIFAVVIGTYSIALIPRDIKRQIYTIPIGYKEQFLDALKKENIELEIIKVI